MAVGLVIAVSGVAGFGTFAFLASDSSQVTSAETTEGRTPYETTTTSSEPEPAEEEEEPEEDPPAEEEEAEPAPTTTAPEEPAEPAPEPDDGGGVSGPGPEETVRAFWEAMRDGDCENVIDLMTEESWSMGGSISREDAVTSCEQSPAAAAGLEVQEVKLTAEEQNEAAADVTFSYSGQTMTQSMGLRVEDGRWKVANY